MNMKIALHDAEREHMPHKTFPNYALMKISAYHKSLGDTVEWWNPFDDYDLVYSSKVFDFTPENPYLPPNTIKGGTGYGIFKNLSPEIDSVFPDYKIYPDCDYAIGYLTRGCIRKCPWCYVPQKEGYIKPYRKWQELVRNDTKNLVLMDNNILACDYGIDQLSELSKTDYRLDINQGMDIRLLNEEVVHILSKIKWQRFIRFSCDTKSQLPFFERGIRLFEKYGISRSRIFIYVLVRKDIEDAEKRVRTLNEMSRSLTLYAQAERNEPLGLIPNKMQLEFAQRYVYGRLYKREQWSEYCRRKNINEQD